MNQIPTMTGHLDLIHMHGCSVVCAPLFSASVMVFSLSLLLRLSDCTDPCILSSYCSAINCGPARSWFAVGACTLVRVSKVPIAFSVWWSHLKPLFFYLGSRVILYVLEIWKRAVTYNISFMFVCCGVGVGLKKNGALQVSYLLYILNSNGSRQVASACVLTWFPTKKKSRSVGQTFSSPQSCAQAHSSYQDLLRDLLVPGFVLQLSWGSAPITISSHRLHLSFFFHSMARCWLCAPPTGTSTCKARPPVSIGPRVRTHCHS